MIKHYFLPIVLFCIVIVFPFRAFGQNSGQLVGIEYPGSISAGEQLSVTMTVTNTGLGTWLNVCAYVGYIMNDQPVLTLCPNLGMLEPGESATYTCSTESGIPGTPDRIWSGIGSPFGWEDCRTIVQVELAVTIDTSNTTTSVDPPISSTTTTTQDSNNCFLEHIYGTHSETIQTLKCLRNTLLMSSQEGREIIRLYNEYNPLILTLIKEDTLIKNELKNTIDGLIPFITVLLANSFPNKNRVNRSIPSISSE